MDQHQVGVHPREHLAALHAFVRARVQPLQVCVHVVADVVEHRVRHPTAVVPPQRAGPGPQHRGADQHQQPGHQRTGVFHQRAVHHHLLDQGDQHQPGGPADGGHDRDGDVAPLPAEIGREPTQPAFAGGIGAVLAAGPDGSAGSFGRSLGLSSGTETLLRVRAQQSTDPE